MPRSCHGLATVTPIAQAVFLLKRGQTDRQTDATEFSTHAGGYTWLGLGFDLQLLCTHAGSYTAGVGNKRMSDMYVWDVSVSLIHVIRPPTGRCCC